MRFFSTVQSSGVFTGTRFCQESVVHGVSTRPRNARRPPLRNSFRRRNQTPKRFASRVVFAFPFTGQVVSSHATHPRPLTSTHAPRVPTRPSVFDLPSQPRRCSHTPRRPPPSTHSVAQQATATTPAGSFIVTSYVPTRPSSDLPIASPALTMPAARNPDPHDEPDLYQTLGISSVASSTEIRRAYRTLITKVRPGGEIFLDGSFDVTGGVEKTPRARCG